MIEKHNLIGQKFSRLTVIDIAGKQGKKRLWLCKCDCGNLIEARTDQLRREESKSCGCLQKELTSKMFTKHGKSCNRLYKVWTSLKQRCLNPKAQHYNRYGGRGITVCDEWANDFMAFFNWAAENGYQRGLTIDREDNDSGYSPENCRWVTQKVNDNNRHQNNQYGKGSQVSIS